MSTLGQPQIEPAWKQEVNRRLAAHKSRKGAPAAEQVSEPSHSMGNSRAAQAAARVAARYAKAPTYSQMQAEEARAAVRAAEIATQVALEAQAAAENALAGLHAAANEPPLRGPAVVESIERVARVEAAEPSPEPVSLWGPDLAELQEAIKAVAFSTQAGREPEPAALPEPAHPEAAEPEPAAMRPVVTPPVVTHPVVTHETIEGKSFDLRWEPDLPLRALERKPSRAEEEFELSAEDWWTPAQVSATLRSEPIAVETQPAYANLIEFPRELVATRKMRPRLAEAPVAAETRGQLSIFEVDPGAVSAAPGPVAAATQAEAAWTGPEWSGIELDEHPLERESPAKEPVREQHIYLAPLGRRLMAMVVDGSLILAGFFALAMTLVARMPHPPTGKGLEAMAVLGLLLAGFAYHALFFGLGRSTAGMYYAGIALCTFDEESPTRAQLRRRLGAMAVSLLPVGLGMVWSVFDEDHLSWHDRISQTYLRKR